jgi:hypothetical protein
MKNLKHVKLLKLVPNTRLRENVTNQDNINIVTNVNPGTTDIIPNRDNSINEMSNFNLGAYSEFTGNNVEGLSESGYINRNFESHLDEIFNNITYLITTEK